jgi:hypothetical protein
VPQPPPPGYIPVGYVPAAAVRKGHRGRNWAIGCGGLLVVVVLIIVIIGAAAQKATQTVTGNTNCSPAPCGEDGSGFQVYVDSLNRNVPQGDTLTPDSGNHYVQVTVHFVNKSSSEGSANPFNFVLQDPAGVKHTVSLTADSQCPFFEAVNVVPGATLTSKTMCFQAGGDPKGKLILVWTPQLHDIDIDLTGAKAAVVAPTPTP